jgi:hypothetical protein
MTNPLRIRTRVDSETLHLPELRPLIGKEVEITVREAAATPSAGTSGANGDPLREDKNAWRSRYDAMLAEARRNQQHLPPGYTADDSRDGVYEGRGE